jgi:hypothetical protein
VPLGIILPNMACRTLFLSVVCTFSGLRRMFRPQKVKNMVTSSPMAAAPLAMMKAAMTRSKSPLNRMIVFLVVVSTICLLWRCFSGADRRAEPQEA